MKFQLPNKKFMHSIKILNFKFRILLRSRSGQSLIEVLVGLAIGAILIGSAGLGIAFMMKSTTSSDDLQVGSGLVRQTMDEVRSYASANWQNIYGLTKGTNTPYFVNASGTTFYTIEGKKSSLSRDITSGLVGKWSFDEATGTIAYDMSGNGNNGTMYNNPTRTTSTCAIGYCLNFNGSNTYIQITDTSYIKPALISVSAWFNTTDKTISQRVVSKTESGSFQISLNENSACGNSTLCFLVYISGTGYKAATIPISSISNSTWYHVVGTYDGSVVRLYLNGTLISSTSQSGSIGYSTTPLCVGSESTSGSCIGGTYFSGKIDDVRIYNRALSATEIKNLYESKSFSVFFHVENVCRSNDASSTITDTEPCQDGSIVDPSTQKITAKAEWNVRGATNTTELVDYLTRWANKVFHQTDWSGGSGADGPISNPNTEYSSSTNIDATTNPGSIRINL